MVVPVAANRVDLVAALKRSRCPIIGGRLSLGDVV
jgi:hypothetical protein